MKKDLLQKNRSLLKSETGTVYKEPGGRLNICLVYPNTYTIGMSNLGFTGLYSLLNQRDDVVCERAFLPGHEDPETFDERGVELFSMESQRPLHAFDIMGFSVSFENDYPNVLRILGMAKIEAVAVRRTENTPLIIMGGPCAFMNPEPLAPFVDVVFVGEAEEMFDRFIDLVQEHRDRKTLLVSAAQQEGLYVPSLYAPSCGEDGKLQRMKKTIREVPSKIRRQYIRDINTSILVSRVTAPNSEFKGMFLIEAMRGCPFSCRFCSAGHIYGPPRTRKADVVKKVIHGADSGVKVGLIAPSLTDYGGIKGLLEMDDVYFSITSLRASKRSAEIVALLKDKKSVSIAPEAGSQRLRDVIKKKISQEDILTTAGVILSGAVKTLRLYFMVGLPTEREEDIDAVIDLVKKIRGTSGKGKISVTLSVFVPKPFTPFQWHPMTESKIIKERIRRVRKALTQRGIKVRHDAVKDASMQGLFAQGDRRVGNVLLAMQKEKDWRRACKESGIDPAFYIYRRKERNEVLPWDLIDNGVAKEKLWDEYVKALKG